MSTKKRSSSSDSEFADVVAKTKGKPIVSAKTTEADARHKEEVKQAMSALSVDKALQSVSGSSLQVSKAFAQLSEDLIQQTNQLEMIKQAIAIEKEELERLHGVHTVASTIDQLVAEHDAQKTAFATECANRQAAWLSEQAEKQTKWAREDADRKLTREREEQEYGYRMEQARRADRDGWEETKHQRARIEQDRIEQLGKTWKEREEILAKAEAELNSLRQQVSEFPTRLDAEVKKAEAIVGRSMKKDYEADLALRTSQWDGKFALLTQEIATFRDQIKAKDAEIVELRVQRAASEQNVKEIATKAVDAASSKMSFAELSSLRTGDTASTRKPS